MRLTAAVMREGRRYVAQCLEVDVASQGHTVEESLASLREALELYLEDGPRELSAQHRSLLRSRSTSPAN